MTKAPYRTDHYREFDVGARLGAKYGLQSLPEEVRHVYPEDGVTRVTEAIYQESAAFYQENPHIARRPAPDVGDCLDALALVEQARTDAVKRLNRAEAQFIEAAIVKGATWAQVGEALGHTPETAERAARARYAYLAKKRGAHHAPLPGFEEAAGTVVGKLSGAVQ